MGGVSGPGVFWWGPAFYLRVRFCAGLLAGFGRRVWWLWGWFDPDSGTYPDYNNIFNHYLFVTNPNVGSITLWELSLDPFNDFDVGAGNIMEEKPSLGVFDSSGMGADI